MSRFEIMDDLSETDSPWQIPDRLKDLTSELYPKVIKGTPSVKTKLLKLIRQYPNQPIFRNYLANWYEKNDMQEKALEENRTILRLFPSYIFARSAQIIDHLRSGEIQAAENMLGKEWTITGFCPERHKFHLSEFSAYTSALVEYLAATSHFQKAKDAVKELLRYGASFQEADRLGEIIDLYQEKEHLTSLRNDIEDELFELKALEEPIFSQRQELMEARDHVFAFLYEGELWEINPKALQESIDHNKGGLLKELRWILQIAIERYEFCEEQEAWSPAVLHALLILSYLDADRSFPFVLNLLRQPDRCIDFWLGDWGDESLKGFFKNGTSDHLMLIKHIIQERHLSEHVKNILLELLPLLVKHQPEMRTEVVAVIKELIDYFEIHQDDKAIFNPSVLGFIVGAAVDVKATELLEDIRLLYESELIDPTVEGAIEEVEQSLFSTESRILWKTYNDLPSHLKAISGTKNR